jgi:cyclopropane fatty-acyl-phospholipid synthase-like methyltransferase
MENFKKKEFQNSLDLTSDELDRYIPELLKGLWELGSMPEYVIELIRRNDLGKEKNIIDFGCGKGAVLVKLAKQFDITATGVDIVADFIEEAKKHAKICGVSEKILFKTEDIIETVKKTSQQDIVIYGYDSEILGDLGTTLRQLTNCVKSDGYIILEFMFADQMTEELINDKEMKQIIEQTGYRIIDRIDWNREILKQTNRQNTEVIQENVNRLIFQYSDKKEIFNEYLQNQIDECEELENEYICTTLLLKGDCEITQTNTLGHTDAGRHPFHESTSEGCQPAASA